MSRYTYTLSTHNPFLTHFWQWPQVFRDSDASNESELEAQVRSGDYFATIATILDTISLELKTNDSAQSILLQRLITELLYLQQHYEIKKKKTGKF